MMRMSCRSSPARRGTTRYTLNTSSDAGLPSFRRLSANFMARDRDALGFMTASILMLDLPVHAANAMGLIPVQFHITNSIMDAMVDDRRRKTVDGPSYPISRAESPFRSES